MPKNLYEISKTGTLGVIVSNTTQGSGHFENTMQVLGRFLSELKWKSATIWLLLEVQPDDEEEDAEANEIKNKIEGRLVDWFEQEKILCKPNVFIWKEGSEIPAEDLICITGGLDVSSVQPMPMKPNKYTWNTNFTAINTRYLIQCQPLWWEGENEKWDGSDDQQYTYVNGAQSGLWRVDGKFEYEDGDMLTPEVVPIDTPETLPQRIIRPLEYQELDLKRASKPNPNFFSVIMYGNYPAGKEKLEKHKAIYERMLKCFQYITNLEDGRPIKIIRISSGETKEAEEKINDDYRSEKLEINAVDRLPKGEFQEALCHADLMVSEGQNIEDECLSIHVPVFQWRDVQDLKTNNRYNVMVPGLFQDLEKDTRANLGDNYLEPIHEFAEKPSGDRFLAMMKDGLGNYNPEVWAADKLSILLTALEEYLKTTP